MRKLISLMAVTGALLCSTACYKSVYVHSGLQPEAEPTYKSWRHHLVQGLVSLDNEVNVDDLCPQTGVARIEHVHSFVNMLIAGLTGYFYSPTTLKVYCGVAGAQLDIDSNDALAADLEAAEDLTLRDAQLVLLNE